MQNYPVGKEFYIHIQLFSGAMVVIFGLGLHLCPQSMCASSGCSGETACMPSEAAYARSTKFVCRPMLEVPNLCAG